jgi:hypothetical protein
MYRHGSILDQLQSRDRSVTMDELIDIYQLADKYDIPEIRRNVDSMFCELAYIHFSGKNASTTFESYFVNCIARVCGPNSIQLADNTIKNSILQICHEVCIRLFQNNTFRQWYREGELFDVESAATFGMGLGRRLLASNGIAAEESDGFPEIKPPTWVLPTAERYVIVSIPPGMIKNVRLIVTFQKAHDRFLRRQETLRHHCHLLRPEDIGSQDHSCDWLVLLPGCARECAYSQSSYHTFLRNN